MSNQQKILFFALTLTLLAFTHGKPANNLLDNVTADDASLNAVDPIRKSGDLLQTASDTNKNKATVQITGISTGIDTPSISSHDSETNTQFKPQRAGTMFARFIDDIFNIPITVLQSVAKLVTNPFTTSKNKTPEEH